MTQVQFIQVSPQELATLIQESVKQSLPTPPFPTIESKQKEILTKFALALGFTPGNVPFIIDKALSLLILNVDLDTFVYEMTHMNK
jgi:hypothetical protein